MRRLTLAALLLVAASAVAQDVRHFIYTPDAPLTDASRASLAAEGIRVLRPLTNGRYVVSVTAGERGPRVAATSTGQALEPFTPEQKIHRSAMRAAGQGRATVEIQVAFHNDVTMDEAREAVAAAGAALEDPLAFRFGPMRQLRVRIAPSSLTRLAEDDRVAAIGGGTPFRIRTDNANAAKLSRVTELHQAPYGLTGEGVALSLFEPAEAQASHPEFEGRLTLFATGGGTSDRSHATHVAGTIAAAGIDPKAKGMAPRARLYEFKAVDDEDVWLGEKLEDLLPLGVVADNNSWGYILAWNLEGGNYVWYDAAEYFGWYEPFTTAAIDEIAKATDLLFVHSAGNDGDQPGLGLWGQHKHVDNELNPITNQTWCYSQNGSGTDCPAGTCSAGAQYCEKERHLAGAPWGTVGLTASGKNTIAVGAVGDSADIAGFSSRGPAKDGRVKPDVVARGIGQYSTNTSGGYTTKSGTSMAAPVVTGIAGLLTEQWRRTFGSNPSGTELKAVIIAGTRDLGNAGPDYSYGFGLVDAKASADLILADGGTRTQIRNGSLAQGQQFEMELGLRAAQNLRVVVSWPDPEIILLANDELETPVLVNDLDVTVVDPAGNVVLPWTLSPAGVSTSTSATRAANKRDNTEMVEIANAVPGRYRVIVSAPAIKDQSPQRFTVVANAAAIPPCVDRSEQNDSAGAAYGNLVTGQLVSAAFCSASDADFFRFESTKTGAVTVAVNAGDTAVRATLTSGGNTLATIDVPAGTSRTLTATATTVPQQFILQFTPIGERGFVPTYSFTPTFGQIVPARRRTVRN